MLSKLDWSLPSVTGVGKKADEVIEEILLMYIIKISKLNTDLPFLPPDSRGF